MCYNWAELVNGIFQNRVYHNNDNDDNEHFCRKSYYLFPTKMFIASETTRLIFEWIRILRIEKMLNKCWTCWNVTYVKSYTVSVIFWQHVQKYHVTKNKLFQNRISMVYFPTKFSMNWIRNSLYNTSFDQLKILIINAQILLILETHAIYAWWMLPKIEDVYMKMQIKCLHDADQVVRRTFTYR